MSWWDTKYLLKQNFLYFSLIRYISELYECEAPIIYIIHGSKENKKVLHDHLNKKKINNCIPEKGKEYIIWDEVKMEKYINELVEKVANKEGKPEIIKILEEIAKVNLNNSEDIKNLIENFVKLEED